ncbi:TPM domain-containing protein [Flavobacterium sp. RHBU_24]|uniref:TPM domain-containing protein n=1 Tax=Flavobacterium sp. RHBU_24 TaxID=3391185 RepID=UPI0039855052
MFKLLSLSFVITGLLFFYFPHSKEKFCVEKESSSSVTLNDLKQQPVFPRQMGLLNDTENIFTAAQKQELDKILLNYDKNTDNKILIVSARSFKAYDDYQTFAAAVADKWRIDFNNKGRVILITFSKANRKIALTKAKGVALSDEECQKVISEKAIPELKKNNYYNGIKNAVLELTNKWK